MRLRYGKLVVAIMPQLLLREPGATANLGHRRKGLTEPSPGSAVPGVHQSVTALRLPNN
jgi:hypothetical protein